MTTVTVYDYRWINPETGRSQMAYRMATLAAIESAHGTPIMRQVAKSRVTGWTSLVL